MFLKRKFEIFLLVIFFLFSFWLMYKSFGYDDKKHDFRIARHQVGDFGLHLSLIRSFSWGNNFPAESPFFPGRPLPYHYYFDLLTGLLERAGLRMDIAFNGLSILFFTLLLFLIYKLPLLIFKKSRLLGILSVILFIFHSNLAFIDFFKEKRLSLSTLRDFWLLPDYIHKGPFDGSIISIFFTLNVYLNQRHLIMAFAISLTIIYFLLSKLIKVQKISNKVLILLGLVLGFLSRVHTLTFFSTAVVLFLLFILFKRSRLLVPLFVSAVAIFFFHAKDIVGQDLNHIFFNPGFLSEKPLSFMNFIYFWGMNLGLAIILIPCGFFLSGRKQKLIFLSVFSLFMIGNIFQLSFLIDHNHSLFNLFIIFANFYIAYFLVTLLSRYNNFVGRAIFIFLVLLLTMSGSIDLMAVKNDFQLHLNDAPSDRFMQWIKTSTKQNDIFLAKQEILDPITLSGRKSYLGHQYYLSVMGYNYSERLNLVKSFYEAPDLKIISRMRKENIAYITVPAKPIIDFNYTVNFVYLDKYLQKVYEDSKVIVYKL
ncbi:MAG: hypothetical protein Q7K54_00615 [Candidatus Parcubacteria bacterium]|nr:hypothetical protein [Candidatus Parcubacteria bacterium]